MVGIRVELIPKKQNKKRAATTQRKREEKAQLQKIEKEKELEEIRHPKNLYRYIFGSDDYTSQDKTKEELNEALDKVFSILDEREQLIFKKHFGLDGEEPKNYREIGDIIGVSNSRVIQIERKALRKLRRPSSTKILFFKENKKSPITPESEIEELDFSVRTFNTLKRWTKYGEETEDRYNVTIQDILNKSPEELSKLRNLGRSSHNEIIDKMNELGHSEWVENHAEFLERRHSKL